MAAHKDPIYGPVKAFSYLSAEKNDSPSGLVRRDNSIRRDPQVSQGSQAANLNRRSLYPPDEPDSFDNSTSSHHGQPNTGYDASPVSSRRQSGGSQRHPMSPESHPTLFDNFILKEPGPRSSQEAEPPHAAPSRNSTEDSRGRTNLQDLFQEPAPRSKPDDRSTKYSSQASSTMALLSDRNSASSGRLVDPYPNSNISPTSTAIPIEPAYSYNKNISLNADPKYNYDNSQVIQAPTKKANKNGEFFPQLGSAPLPAQASPKLRPVTHADDLNTLMRRGTDSSFGSPATCSRCTFFIVLLVVILICLGIGFAIGWFAYKMANGNDGDISTPLGSTTTISSTTLGGTDASAASFTTAETITST